MAVDVKALRRKVKALGRPRRGRRIPDELRAELTQAALELRASGRKWSQVGEDLGISYETARRYCEESSPAAVVPVHVVERADESPLVLVSPRGYRVEGLTLADAASLLRALS